MRFSKHFAVLLLGFSVAVTSVFADDSAKKERHVFLLIGQSNMAGRAKIEEQDKADISGVFLWNIADKKWESATPPYNRHSPSRKDIKMQRLNCGPSFAAAYAKVNPKIEVGIVCAARGGSSIEQWDRENPDKFDLYRHAMDAIKAALKEGGELKGILWHQGEANRERTGEYPAQLKELVKRLRKDLDAANLPFVFGQIARWNPEYPPFNKMILKQPANIPYTAVAKTDSLKGIDAAHFDSAGQRELGKRYAVEMLALLIKQ